MKDKYQTIKIDVPPPKFTPEVALANHQKRIEDNQALRDRALAKGHSITGEAGFCDRCGKSVTVSTGTWHEGKYYGPDCIKKITTKE